MTGDEMQVGARVVVAGGRVVHTIKVVDERLASTHCEWLFFGGYMREVAWTPRLATPDDTRECPKCAKRMGAAAGVVLQREVKGG